MALRDPGMIEFSLLIKTEEMATEFARQHGLLLSEANINRRNYLFFIFSKFLNPKKIYQRHLQMEQMHAHSENLVVMGFHVPVHKEIHGKIKVMAN